MRNGMFSTKIGASRLLMGVVIGLITMKAIVAWLGGSVSILAQAADSLFDLIAGIVTFLAVRAASKPADEEHPYGHGKWEDIAGMVQGGLIFAAGGLVVYAAVRRLLTGAVVELTGAGMIVMGISIAVSVLLSRHLYRVARETRSAALEANARNIAADVYSAAAVLIGLLVIRLTGLNTVDSIIALAVAGYIFWLGYKSVSVSVSVLVDTRLDPEQEAVIEACLAAYANDISGYHKLRTRRSGSQRHVDLHLVLDREISLEQAHDICDRIEREIKKNLHGTQINIHIEPCDDNCAQCPADCSRRTAEQTAPPGDKGR